MIETVLLLLVGGSLLVSSVAKLASLRTFAATVSALSPRLPAKATAASFAAVELSAAVLVLTGRGRSVGSVLVVVLGLVISSVSLQTIRKGLQLDCACFGTLHSSRLGVSNVVMGFGYSCAGLWIIFNPVGAELKEWWPLLLGLGLSGAILLASLVHSTLEIRYQRHQVLTPNFASLMGQSDATP